MEQKVKVFHSTIAFDGDLTDRNLKAIPEDFKGDIVVYGNVSLTEPYAKIHGNLWVHGNISAWQMKIHGDVTCGGNIYTWDSEFVGNLTCKGSIDVYGDIDIAGNLNCDGDIYAETLDIAGEKRCNGQIHAKCA